MKKSNHTGKREIAFPVRYRFRPGNRSEVQAAYAQLAEFIRSVLGSDATSNMQGTVTAFESAKARHQRRKREAS